ncbi:single-stranded-DNA-specific exonuclease RecJ [Achromobacter anxifer]|uniref:single-stranded-DNA-specific exonuclease RecJ n=1 Tax=Achromobacter anxifer TaxID=1287737 RepID=UPI0015925214|nr:single-stranded-DNA-specific exonuclease RecJ [Achromobacter anxifer]
MPSTCILQRRSVDSDRALSLQTSANLSPLEAAILSSRGMVAGDAVPVAQLMDRPMMDLERGAKRILAAIRKQEPIVVVADYDCDGATACAVSVAGLRALGAKIDYVVPDRMVHGYGISPSVVDLVLERFPATRVLITVDNGILGHAGLTHAANRGLEAVVTDHHLPGDTLPDAVAVINPSRKDCTSGLQKLAGVSVALWLVVLVKKLLAAQGVNTPPLSFLLAYVTIGTIADMVPLDAANRALVVNGMQRLRRLGDEIPVGVRALIQEASLPQDCLTTQDIGFGIAPRINAAGRLETMDAGIDLLLATDPKEARRLARLLTETNDQRKALQKEASDDAATAIDFAFDDKVRALVFGSESWHPGIVGLVASRVKDTYHRPSFIFSLLDGVAKGSGRSIPGLHLKDALEEVARRAPGVLAKFGGHAMAAGATLSSPQSLAQFRDVFDQVARERITDSMLDNILQSDGPMPDLTLESAARLMRHPWGQGFEAPAFDDEAKIRSVKPLGQSGLHWKVEAAVGGRSNPTTIVLFNQRQPAEGEVVPIYLQPGLNTWNDRTTLQWIGRLLN